MVDLQERLNRASTAFTEGVSLQDPSQMTSDDVVPVGETSSGGAWAVTDDLGHRRRGVPWVLSAALVAAAAALVAVVVFSGGEPGVSVTGAPAAEGGSDPGVSQAPAPVELAAMSPGEALDSMASASLAAQSWVRASTVETVEGEAFGAEPGTEVTNPTVVFNAPGLVEMSTQISDGSRITNEYLDFTAGRQYWLTGPDQWKSATITKDSVTDPRMDLEAVRDSEGCVSRVDDRSVLVIVQPTAACPATAPPREQWAALGDGKHLVTAGPDGRVASTIGFTDEIRVPELAGLQMVDRYTQYNTAPSVTLPDPSIVEEVTGDFRGSDFFPDTGYIAKYDPDDCRPSGAAECPQGS